MESPASFHFESKLVSKFKSYWMEQFIVIIMVIAITIKEFILDNSLHFQYF